MLHHLSFSVSDLNRAASFYDAVLGELDFVRVWTAPDAIGYGVEGGDDRFAIKHRTNATVAPSLGFHIAFAAKSRKAVDAFHSSAIRNGGTDDGLPGLRPHYGKGYYAAFIIDPDGYHIEAVIID